MQKLRFYARGDLLVAMPGLRHPFTGGTLPQYVGRKMRPSKDAAGKPNGFALPATKEPAEFPADGPEAKRLKKLMRREHSLWAADEETAKACGVLFVPVEFADGEWVAKATAKPKPTESSKASASADEPSTTRKKGGR